jgi:hypothetical protein
MGNTTHPRKAHYFAYQLNSKAKFTLATYQCLAQLRGSDNDSSEGNKEDEGSKGNSDGGYGEDVDKRDHGGGNDGKW